MTSDRSCWLLKRLWLKRPQPNGVKPEPHGPFGTKPTNPSRAARLGFPSHVKTVAPVGRATGGKGGGNRQGALIARLHSYLRQLQREDRRIAIAEKLGERHRVALELWIQANQWGSAPRQSEPDDLPGPDRKPKKAKCGENFKSSTTGIGSTCRTTRNGDI